MCKICGVLIGVAFLAASGIACSGDSSSGEPSPGDPTLVSVGDLNMEAPLIVYEASAGESKVADLYLIDPESGKRARLTDGTTFNAGPAWSPDEQTIIFASTRDGQDKTDVYTMARDGSSVARITNSPDDAEYEPRFAPDGSSIAYVRDEGDNWILSLMDPDGSNPRDLTEPQKFIEFPTWDPDGSRLVFAGIPAGGQGSPDIYAVPVTGGALELVVATESTDVCPHFTRDGSVMLYATIAEGEDQLDVFARDADMTDPSAGSDRRLTTDPGKDDYGKPGADGRVVFVSERDGNPELYLMNLDGSNQRRLTHTPDVRENLPSW